MASQTITLRQFETSAAKAATEVRGASSLGSFLKSAGLMMVAEAKLNIKSTTDPNGQPFRPLAHSRPAGGGKPLNDRGLLGASITSAITGAAVTAGTNRVGAALHQFGGIVRATRRKFLTIPLTKVASRAGGARRFPGKLHARIKGAKGVLVDERGVAQYALVKSIRVPPRPFLGFGRRLLSKLDLLAQEFLAKRVPGGA